MKTAEIIKLILFAIVCAMITGMVIVLNLAVVVVLLADTGYVLTMAASICMLKDFMEHYTK